MSLFGSFSFFPKPSLGVDIGTSALRVAELSRWGPRTTLKNYGAVGAHALYENAFRTMERNTLTLSAKDIGRALRAVLQEAGIERREAAFSIPDFSSFFTNFALPPLSKEELPGAVRYEARRHVPVPISEVVFDWQVTKGRVGAREPLQVLLVAVPNEVVNQYQQIAKLAGLRLASLEAEVFGFLRSSVPDPGVPQMLLDIGAQSTTMSVVAGSMVAFSHSTDTAGYAFTSRIADALGIDRQRAEARKRKEGLNSKDIARVLAPLLDVLLLEMQKASGQADKSNGIKTERVVLGGASAALPGLSSYIAKNVPWQVRLAAPFRNVFYPSALESTIQTMGPGYAVAVGMALRGLE